MPNSANKRSAADYLPPQKKWTLRSLKTSAETCRGCDLYKRATQVVFGEGPRQAKMMIVGEIPGDQEDQQGHPFVGPAGKLLDDVLQQVGLERRDVYVTNAVKHFSWEERGKRRLHKKPRRIEVVACRPWLEAELAVIKPKLIVCLGVTAAQSFLGTSFRITKQRGTFLQTEWAPWLMATYHPSAILRAPDKEQRDRMRTEFQADFLNAITRLGST
jgi:uracil-DNA glycosylase family protein